MKGLSKLLREAIPEIIGSIIGGLVVEVVLAVIGKQTGIGIWPVIVIIVGCVWSGCVYLAFKRTPPLVEGGKGTWQYPRWRRWALTGMVTILLLTASGVGYHLYQQAQPPTKVILLVADFDGPEPQKYGVTDAVLNKLRQALVEYDDVQIEALGRAITEVEGSAAARAEGQKREAAIVIWGWYRTPGEIVPLSVHFEVLRPQEHMPELRPEAKGLVQTMAVAELESFTLQTHLSTEMAYLSLFTVGMARYVAEDWDGAIASFSYALSQTAERVLALDQSIVYFYRAIAYDNKGDLERAITDYDRANQLQPDLVEPYNNRGIIYGQKGELERAIADFDQAIQLQPDLAVAYYNRGLAYDRMGDYDRAIASYTEAIAFAHLLPDKGAGAYNNRAVAYDDKGETDCAIADYDKAIELKPDYAEAYNNRGVAYVAQGDLKRAIIDFDQAIQLEPDYAEAYHNRGLAYDRMGDYDRAIASYTEAIAFAHLLPDKGTRTYNNRGVAYVHKCDTDRAIADFDRAIQLQPDYAGACYNRGAAYMEKGEKEKAIADFKKVLELSNDPNLRQQAEEQLKALGAK